MKTKKVISEPDATTLYQRVGKKYVPVAEYADTDYWREGCYQVIVRPGYRSIKSCLFPPREAAVEAALTIVGEGMVKKMLDAAVTPRVSTPLSTKQVRAFKAFKEAFKTDVAWLPSAQDVVEAGLEELRKYFKEVDK